MDENIDLDYIIDHNPLHVNTPGGGSLPVLNKREVDWYDDKKVRYLDQNIFTNITDLQEVDRILFMELMIFRWSSWLSLEVDEEGDRVDVKALQRQIKEYSTEIRQVKESVGLDKPSREKEKGESVPEYLSNLKRRAKEFGVMREKQLTEALILFKELEHLYGLYQRCTPEERNEPGGINLEGLFKWLEDVCFPEFNAIDEYFQTHQQKFWIKEI